MTYIPHRVVELLLEKTMGPTDNPGDRVEILLAAWEEMHREAQATREALEAAIRKGSPSTDWVAIPHEEWRELLKTVRPSEDAQPGMPGARWPKPMTAQERAELRKGEFVMLASWRFVVISSPGDKGHPVLLPPPESVFIDPDVESLYRDRREHRGYPW